MKTITFKTVTQAALFEHELVGQISDGHWEGKQGDHWVPWCRCEIRVGKVGERVGRNFHVNYDRYNFLSKDLLKCVGKRMLVYARLAKAGWPMGIVREVGDGFYNLDGEFTGPPNFKGKFWDGIRRDLNRYNAEQVRADVESSTYSMKELKADLREIKAAIRNHVG